MMKHALVVDDEPAICHALCVLLTDLDCQVSTAATAEQALELVANVDFSVIALDVRLPGMDGLAALPRIKEHTAAPVLLMTAHGDLSTAVSAVQLGAFEYLSKPFDLDNVTAVLKRALAIQSGPKVREPTVAAANTIVGNSAPMQQLFRQIALAAQHDEPVLITGESGVGKELVAHAIHQNSERSKNDIVPVHLASLSDTLMERELFGHVAGAYTGANESQQGLIGRANEGTLFLDEIGETPHPVQVKLLRTIETREYYRVGSSTPEVSDFRLIAATNRPIDYLRSSDAFRPDLFFRLSTIHIHVPSLRDRKEDIPALAQFLLDQNPAGRVRQLSDDAVEKLQSHDFPGNVRELKNIVLRAAAQVPDELIAADCIVIESAANHTMSSPPTEPMLDAAAAKWAVQAIVSSEPSLLATANEITEREVIRVVLAHCEGNRSAAAGMLGIHRETLRDKIARLGLGAT